MGATRGRIFRLGFSESFLLSVAGTIGGVWLGAAGIRFLETLAPITEARKAAFALDGKALAFAAGLAFLTAVLAGFPPALAAWHVTVADLLRSDSRGTTMRHRLLRGLIVTQIALAFMLANIAVVFSTSYAKLLRTHASLDTEYVLSAELNLCGARYEKNGAQARFCDQLAGCVAALPGVAAAGLTSQLPLGGGASRSLLVNDEVFDPEAERRAADCSEITAGYFAAAGLPLLQGRTLQPGSVGPSIDEVVVNRALADKCWPGQNALGKVIRPNAAAPWFKVRVVGVVGNLYRQALELKPAPQMYWTVDRAWGKKTFLIVRSSQPAAFLTPALRQAVAELDPDSPLSRIRTFKTIVRDATLDSRLLAEITNGCMIVGIALVAVGLYGTLSYYVLQRTREIGVRMALGATGRDVVGMVLRQGFRWVMAGTAIGIIGALASAAALRTVSYDVNPVNPLVLAAATSAVFIAAAMACWLPARRAAKIHPMEALRYE
jgi:predicted permease